MIKNVLNKQFNLLKINILIKLVSKIKLGIIYASTKKDCENISEKLNEANIKSGFYHGGLEDK